ncbi:FAD-dependent oxidoreductase [Dysosmobacter sp.]|uniref:FAD-dependent oxidoreductase n=1 Tax=Dysosmobacter sp. TaxID=2591382 RepID=UPI002A87D598|nr:FAD-dependent oxidoreductase [Dysosmobacter sp.]MDY3282473.1 FAD-dependent oxidoreductase [Dysosmobacter sp.]
MKVLIVGGVAAGTKVAAKLKREHRDAEVRILTMGADISYAGCGLPYYVGNVIETRDELVVNTPEKFMALTGADVQTGVQVTALDRAAKTVTAKVLATGEEFTESYDKLVISTGAHPFLPPVEGLDLENVFVMRTPDDADGLRKLVDAGEVKRAVVVGGGLIGLEVAENLTDRGVRTSVIDFAPHILSEMLDSEFSEYLENAMADQGVMPFTGVALEGLTGSNGKVEKVLTSKRPMKADAVVLAMGFRPNTEWLADTGLEMFKGTLVVDEYLRTNDPDIYAAGDCALVTNRTTGKRQWSAMGSTANICGRLAAMHIAGDEHVVPYPGVLGTGIAKLPGTNMARVGLTEKAAREAGYEVESIVAGADDKAHYYPGSGKIFIKLICDKNTHQLLGLQTVGKGAVDKMADIAVTAISLGAKLEDLQNCDFAYTPPFSTAIHPFAVAVNALLNKLSGELETFTPAEYAAGAAEGYRVVDCSIQPTVTSAPYLDITKINGVVDGFDPEEKLLLVCNTGKRTYLAQNRLKFYGYKNTRVLEGGHMFNPGILEN